MSLYISGFSDEISDSLDEQIRVVKKFNMQYISLRGVDSKNIGDYTVKDCIEKNVFKRLWDNNIKISSIGSPIGKVFIDDDEGFKKQIVVLHNLCKIALILDCKYIRIFSFFMPSNCNVDDYENAVVEKIKIFTDIAKRYGVILLHENEKDIYGDIASRCYKLFKSVNSENFKAIFDFANFVQCGENTVECYNLLKDYIVYFHIKDASYNLSYNVLCGTGDGQIQTILKMAIKNDDYTGFLTLEPHLTMFGSLKDLELSDASSVINKNTNINGEQGYEMQYNAVKNILNEMGSIQYE